MRGENVSVAPETYDLIEKATRGYLAGLARGVQISTAQLVDALYDSDMEREVAFRAIKALAYGRLADCWSAGPPVMRYGKEVRPKLWHSPVVKTCKHCGGEL
jgi:hypothetical protein